MTTPRRPRHVTATDVDVERYTIAMLALGYARSMIARILAELGGHADQTRYAANLEWLDTQIKRIMRLNVRAYRARSPVTDQPQHGEHDHEHGADPKNRGHRVPVTGRHRYTRRTREGGDREGEE
jgi:hypothetical protein